MQHPICKQTTTYILQSKQSQRMYYSSRKEKQDRQILEENVGYAEGSIREYLNIKRTSKDRCCTVLFCLYMIMVLMITGIGFFYGNFTQIGTFLSSGTECSKFISYSQTTDIYSCDLVACSPPATYGLLQKVCVSSSYTMSNSALSSQVSIYNFNHTFPLMIYSNIGVIVGVILLFSLAICYGKLIYAYIFIAFLLLIGFAFYLLKTIKDRVDSLILQYATDSNLSNSELLSNQSSFQPLAYLLLAAFLILFPVLLFSPSRVKMGIDLLQKMYNYFEQSYTVVIFSMLSVVMTYGIVFMIGFLLLNFFTGGNSTTSDNSFFYIYQKIHLSNPAVLTIYFIGIYWFFTTFGAWHQHIISSSVMQWYFEDGGKFKPVRKGMKRGWYSLGSEAISGILLPFQWIALLLYSVCKMDSQTIQKYQQQHHQDCLCWSNLLYKFRQLMTKFYIKVNRSSAISSTLTNNNYIESCELAAVTFAQRNHRFFNIGGSLTLFINLFSTMVFLFINFFPLYYQNYNVFPAKVTSLSLQIVTSIFLGLAVGQLFSNIFGTSVDTLLFCFLMEKKGQESVSQKQIKKILEELYSAEEDIEQVQQMYEVQSDTD